MISNEPSKYISFISYLYNFRPSNLFNFIDAVNIPLSMKLFSSMKMFLHCSYPTKPYCFPTSFISLQIYTRIVLSLHIYEYGFLILFFYASYRMKSSFTTMMATVKRWSD